MLQNRQSLGDHVVVAPACAQATAAGAAIALVAAATEDGVKVIGQTINRRNAQSCVLAIEGLASLAATKTLSFASEYQESGDGSTWDTAVVIEAATVVATGPGGGGNVHFSRELPINLAPKKKFVRFNLTPDLSATSVDIAVWSASCVLSGFDVLPAVQATT